MYADYGPPGKVIEDAGLKGARRGKASISELHANFIVNEGGASAQDVLELIHLARETVKANTGYALSAEAIYIEPNGSNKSAHVKASEAKNNVFTL